ncbi:unnamed protein product [Ectocarpus sp. 12 AP-2014]
MPPSDDLPSPSQSRHVVSPSILHHQPPSFLKGIVGAILSLVKYLRRTRQPCTSDHAVLESAAPAIQGRKQVSSHRRSFLSCYIALPKFQQSSVRKHTQQFGGSFEANHAGQRRDTGKNGAACCSRRHCDLDSQSTAVVGRPHSDKKNKTQDPIVPARYAVPKITNQKQL